MRIEIRNDSVEIDGYVNAVGRDSRPMTDRTTGQRFVEQIVPGAFKRALTRNEVKILLNHEENRVLGSTESNLKLCEDSIGLRARAVITDPEVIEKAKNGQLRGWSFGFVPRGASEEDASAGLKRRFIEDMDLLEVSIIDRRKIPCYEGTSIEARAEGEAVSCPDALETEIYTVENRAEAVDYSEYKKRIEALEGV